MLNSTRVAAALMALGMGIVTAQELRIVRAEYGHDRRYVDVTEILRRASMRGRLDIIVSNETFGVDPAPAEVKTLRVEYFVNGQPMREQVPENARLLLPRGMAPMAPTGAGPGYRDGGRSLRIVSAQYGAGNRVMDVTRLLQNQVRDGFLVTRVDPGVMRGDPAPGRQKILSVEYEYMGQMYRTQATDFSELRLPEPNVGAPVGGGPYNVGPPVNAPVGDLQIISAFYGSRNHSVDVGRAVAAYVDGGQVRMRINNDTMGVDPDRGAEKFLRVEYAFNGQRDTVQVSEDRDLVLPRAGIGAVGVIPQSPAYANGIVILSAGYGAGNRYVDVARILQGRQAPDGSLRMNVTNDTMGGDPVRGPDKTLRVDYQFRGQTLHKEVREGDQLTLP